MLSGLSGCTPVPGPMDGPADPGTWRVVAIRPGPGGQAPLGPGESPGVAAEVEGEPGYLRATVAVARSDAPGQPYRSSLYDVLFPVGARAKVVAAVVRPPGPSLPPRVVIRVESAGTTSESFVEPAVPFQEPDTSTSAETLCTPDQPLRGGEEVPLARWSVEAPPGRAEVMIGVLFSRRPTGPRLKPEGKPPGGAARPAGG